MEEGKRCRVRKGWGLENAGNQGRIWTKSERKGRDDGSLRETWAQAQRGEEKNLNHGSKDSRGNGERIRRDLGKGERERWMYS